MSEQPLEPEVLAALEAGRKIDAIKELRAQRGIGLKEAKEIIDRHEGVRSLNTAGIIEVKPGVKFRVILFIAALAILGYHLMEA